MAKISKDKVLHDVKVGYIRGSGDQEEVTFGNIAQKVEDACGGISLKCISINDHRLDGSESDGSIESPFIESVITSIKLIELNDIILEG